MKVSNQCVYGLEELEIKIKGATMFIDVEDLEKIIGHRMILSTTGYMMIYPHSTKATSVHRYLMGAKEGEYVDHINENKLDNRKENLRICTNQENLRNQKNVKGVNYRKDRGTWRAYITVDRKQIYLGSFGNELDALQARCDAEKKYFGEFAPNREVIQ